MQLPGRFQADPKHLPYINMHLLHLHLHSFHAASMQLPCSFHAASRHVPHSGAPGGTISKHHLDTTWGTTSHNQLGHLMGTTWCSFHLVQLPPGAASSQNLVCLACQGLLRGPDQIQGVCPSLGKPTPYTLVGALACLCLPLPSYLSCKSASLPAYVHA
jgi:hypothetical protein